MSWLNLSQIAALLNAPMDGSDVAVDAVSTDTRKPLANTLFIALQGPNFDAHEVLEQELSELPAALLVSRPVSLELPQILVDDTKLALGRLAKAWRSQCGATVIGLTGSNGKTTVKEMLSSIFSQAGPTLATIGNLNNDIGVPLTLLRLRPEHQYAIIEMGANHVGEIAYLTDITAPDIALLNNASAAHLEGFGSLENVVKAKGEIFSGLRTNGTAVLNADSPALSDWQDLVADRNQLTFGFAKDAGCRIAGTDPLQIACGEESIEVQLPLPGRHNLMNAAAAAACAVAAGLSGDLIASGLSQMKPVAGRQDTRIHASGAVIIDDSYNANPASMQAAIDRLESMAGIRILIIGDMAELGDATAEAHRQVGIAAKAAGLQGLCALGPASQAAVDAFGKSAAHFDAPGALSDYLAPCLQEGVTMLIKGSRSARMERVVEDLLSRPARPDQECRYAA